MLLDPDGDGEVGPLKRRKLHLATRKTKMNQKTMRMKKT